MRDWNKTFTLDEQKRLMLRLSAKKENANRRGVDCTLDMNDIFMLGFKLLGHGKCDYTDLPFSTKTAGEKGNHNHPKYPTIERIDDTKGYVRGNVCVVMQRANQLKDNLIDKKTATTIIDPVDREIVKAMMLNMSKDHLEALKTKYIPTNIYTKEEEMDKIEKDTNTPAVEAVEDTAVSQEVLPLPDDVAVAKAYAQYCTMFAKAGMKVSVTYSHFKAKYVRKTCALTGELLDEEPKFILVLDLNLGFAKDNFLVVGGEIGGAITTMMSKTGMSAPKIAKILQRVVA